MRILYLDIDSLNPSHLGCYGYHRKTSPTIDAIAGRGMRCTNVYCSDAPCLPSRSALYSGRFGIQTGVVGHGGTAAQPKVEGKDRDFADLLEIESLGFQLQRAGFHTAMVSPFGQRHGAHWFYAGFNEMHNTGRYGHESAEQVTPVAAKWLDDHAAEDNWYLHINYWDVHTPYRVPLEYGEPFAADPLPAWLDDEQLIKRHQRTAGVHSALDLNMHSFRQNPAYPRQPAAITDRPSMRRMIDGYDTAICYVDDQIRLVVDKLKAAGVYEDTAIIISADHGENLGELGIYGDHATADDATCHIPLIIKWPTPDRFPAIAPFTDSSGAPPHTRGKRQVRGSGTTPGRVDDGLHYHLDLVPTLMELLGCPSKESWDGQSFAQALLDGADQGRDELVISQCAHVCQRSVRFGQWLYVRTYHDGFFLFPQQMLFDLAADPHELNDVAPAHPALCREAAWRLGNWHDAQMQKMAGASNDVVDPLWTVIHEGGPYHTRGVLPKYLDRLEATGRSDAAAALRRKYPRLLS
ncbi:MAG: sulfatase [Phycisphaeraceae bacterium]